MKPQDQTSAEPTLRKRGRNWGRTETLPAVRVNVTLDEATKAKARAIGQGELSAGLRIAVAAFEQVDQNVQ